MPSQSRTRPLPAWPLAALTLTALAATGCGGGPRIAPPAGVPSPSAASPSPGGAAPPAAGPSAQSATGSGASPADCHASELRLSAGAAQQAMQHFSRIVLIRLASTRPCALRGYPGVRLVNASGASLATTTHHDSDYLFPTVPPRTVVLQPGQTASFALGGPAADPNGATTCPVASAARIIAPNDTTQVQVPLVLPDCGPIDVSPVVAGAAGPTRS